MVFNSFLLRDLIQLELKKETKIKKKPIPAIPGFEDEVKIDNNVSIDVEVKKLQTAPPSGPNAPKNRWRKK